MRGAQDQTMDVTQVSHSRWMRLYLSLNICKTTEGLRRMRREVPYTVDDRQANGQCEEKVKKYKFKSEGFSVTCWFTLVYDQVNGLWARSKVTCSTNTGKRLTPRGYFASWKILRIKSF